MQENKIIIKICMGSSCHLKGSYQIVEILKKAFENRNDIILIGSLCMSTCQNGVCAEIDGEKIAGLNPENALSIILKKVDEITNNVN